MLLSGVDLRENFLVSREAVRLHVRVGDLVVDRHLENAGDTLFQGGRDAVLTLDGGLQTGGLWEVVSLSAVSDLDVHPLLLSGKLRARSSLYSNTMRGKRGGIP